MADDLQIVVASDPQVIAVPLPDIQVLTETSAQPVVIESPAVEVVTIEEDVHVVDEVRDIQIVTVGEAGPPGAAGAAGPPGVGDHSLLTNLQGGAAGQHYHLPAGVTTGDIPRYNAVSGVWEAVAEPLAFEGLILTPAVAALSVAEGAIYYNLASKDIQVCTDAV